MRGGVDPPRQFAPRSEHRGVVTDDGCEILSSVPKQLVVVD